MVRELTVTDSSPVDVTLSGTIPSGESANWDSQNRVLDIGRPTWGYAISFAQRALNSTPIGLDEVPGYRGFIDNISVADGPDGGSQAVPRRKPASRTGGQEPMLRIRLTDSFGLSAAASAWANVRPAGAGGGPGAARPR